MRNFDVVSDRDDPSREIEVRALFAVLTRRWRTILLPTVLVFVLAGIFVNVVTPRYTGEAQVLLENQETFFTRHDRAMAPSEQTAQLDPEGVGSQIQLITSRDLASRAIKALNLQGDPEFDPAARSMSALNRVLILIGLARDPATDTAESRMLQTFLDKLTVFSPTKTRVITIQFQSKNPDLAARGANTIADLYIAEQSSAKRLGAKQAADALSSEIVDLRVKLAKADAEREQYRAASGLFAGSNNLTISGQQLVDINNDLSRARSLQADAQAKASLILELLKAGKTADVPDVVNNDLVRRVSEQRVTVQTQLALESNTLLPGHPRIKELTAQLAGYDLALKSAAKQAVSSLANESKIAGQRVANLEAVLARQSKIAGTANGDEVRLRSLDRIAQSYKDQLESSTAKYQEALARENSTATPADARIIARARPPQDVTFPKKVPIIAFATIATAVFMTAIIVGGELFAGSSEVKPMPVDTARGTTRSEPLRAETRSSQEKQPDPRPSDPVVQDPVPSRSETHAPAEARSAALRQGIEHAAPAGESAPPRSSIERLREGLVFQDHEDNHGSLLARARAWLGAFGASAAASRATRLDLKETPDTTRDPGEDFDWEAVRPNIVKQRRQVEDRPVLREERAPHEAGDEKDPHEDILSLAAGIVAAHLPGRGVHVVGARVGSAAGSAHDLIALAQTLSDRGRSIIVDLDATPSKLWSLADAHGNGEETIMTLPGLSELLSGEASFAEVIHRDHASRLHFIPTGSREADFRDFDLILDALSETYDFITLLAPDFPQSEIAKVMAPYADFVVLVTARDVTDTALESIEADLIEAGAREVMVIGRPAKRPAMLAERRISSSGSVAT